LALVCQKHGFETVKQARMTGDCLIAMTAARNGLTVVTRNADDFEVIAEFRRFEWQKV
jgi:predicted nucleic acid-binding protein